MTEKRNKVSAIDKSRLRKAKHALLCMQRHSWEHAVTMQAFLEAGDMDTVVLLAKEAAYRASEDGRPALISYPNAVTDPVGVGEALQAAWLETQDMDLEKCIQDMKQWIYMEAPRNTEGLLYHLSDNKQFWVDSCYMLPPVLAALGDPQEGVRQMEGYWKWLSCPSNGLLKHIWNDEKHCFDRDLCWGVGNGWALSGMARLIDWLPEEMEEKKQELIWKEKKLLSNVLRYRCEGGFHDIVDDENSFEEVNLAQMTAYSIYRGITSGWLSADEWLETAEELRKLGEDNLDEYGIIRNACGAPDFNKPGTAPEAQAFYILMEVMAEKTADYLAGIQDCF